MTAPATAATMTFQREWVSRKSPPIPGTDIHPDGNDVGQRLKVEMPRHVPVIIVDGLMNCFLWQVEAPSAIAIE